MYPNLYFAFKDLFGVELQFLKIVNTFGFFVAISFLLAAWLLTKELKRRQALKQFIPVEQKTIIGRPASSGELLLNALLGFLVGFKLIGVFLTEGALNDPQAFIFSGEGSWGAGLLLAALFAGMKWREKDRLKLEKPQEKSIPLWPSDRVGVITILAAVSGFFGAKLFDNLENWDRFIENPLLNMISPYGLTFYGGLIVAGVALAIYFRKHKIPFLRFADAISPSMMLAYGVGRMGCQFSGDGDWGIYNSAFQASPDGSVSRATQNFSETVQQHQQYFAEHYTNLDAIPHTAFSGVSWLPDWFFAYTYPHNVNKEGIALANCNWDGGYCNYLPVPVFPTPLYEIIAALLIFVVLWLLRKRFQHAGRLFGLYLILNGVERFLVEKIRVNTTYNIAGFHPTQAEIISTCLVITGIVLYAMAPKLKRFNAG